MSSYECSERSMNRFKISYSAPEVLDHVRRCDELKFMKTTFLDNLEIDDDVFSIRGNLARR